jgi:SAM-dependent methyltransferase
VTQVLRGVRRLVEDLLKRLGQGSGDGELRREREKRLVAEKRLRRPQQAAPSGFAGQRHALPEPDESTSRVKIFRSLVSPLRPGKMLDLGAGPGTFSVEAARLGWDVTAVDARTMRTPDPGAAKDPERAELIRSVEWIQADVREFPIVAGEYDLICILGLMHHLEVHDQLDLLKRCSGTLTLLDARLAAEVVDTEGPYEGRYRREKGETREERDQIPTASWGNEVTFWHTEESLIRLMRDCGYARVMAMRPPNRPNRTFYLCLPRPE